MKRQSVLQRLRCAELAILAGHGSFDSSAARKCHNIGNDAGVRKVDILHSVVRVGDKFGEAQRNHRQMWIDFRKNRRFESVKQQVVPMDHSHAPLTRWEANSQSPTPSPEPVMRMNTINGKSFT